MLNTDRMKKSISLFALGILGAYAFLNVSGCEKSGKPGAAGTADSAATAAAAAAEGKGELLIWVMPNSPRPEKDMEALLEPFHAANPGVSVKISVLDWGSAWTKLTTAAISGDGPDVVQLGTTWTPFLTDLGALLPLDDLDKEINVQQSFLPSTWAASKPRTSEHITSVPWFIDVRPMFYRTDVFEKAKVDPASTDTWDGFLAGMEKIRAAGIKHHGEAVSPIGFPGKNDWNVVHNFAPWIWSAGGDFLNPMGDKCVLNSPEAMRGILFYLDMVRKGLNPKTNMEKNTAQVSSDFDAGRVATFFESTIKNVYLERPPEQGGSAGSHVAGNYGVLLPPAGPVKRSVFMGGSHLAVFKSSRHPALAKKLLRYMAADSTAQLAYAEISGFLPALNSAFESPYFVADAKRKVFRDIVPFGRCYPAVPYWGEIETAILMKRLGNLFDIAAEVNAPYSVALVQAEMDAAARDIDGQIQAHFKNHPEHMELMHKSLATASK